MAQSSGGYAVTFSIVDQATPQLTKIQREMRQLREPLDRMRRDTQQFIDPTGLRKVSDGMADIGRQASTLFSSMSRLVPVMAGLTGAASLGGVAALGRQWSRFATQLSRDAENIRGTTPQALQTLQRAMTLAGGSAEQTTEALKALTNTAGQALLGDAKAATWFREAGISLQGFNGQLRPTTELLPEVLNYISSLKDPTDRLTAANGFGSAALRDMVQNLERARKPGENLRQTYDRLNAEAAKFPPLTDAQIAAMQRHEAALASLGVSFDSLGQRIGVYMASAFTPFVEAMDTFAKDPETIRAVDALGEAFSALGEAMNWDAILGFLRDTVKEITTLINLVRDAVKWVQSFKEGWSKAWQGEQEGIKAANEGEARFTDKLWNWGKGAVSSTVSAFTGANAAVSESRAAREAAIDAAAATRGAAAPFAGNDNLPPPRSTSGGSREHARHAVDYFQSRGWTHEQSVGIAANLAHESSWVHNVPGDSGQAYGLAQWHPDRQANFRKTMGKDIRQSSHEEQLAFVDWELKNTEKRAGDRLRQATNAQQAGQIVSRYYERPGRSDYEESVRGQSAAQLHSELARAAPAPRPDVASLGMAAPSSLAQRAGALGPLAMAPPASLAQGAPVEVTGGAPVSGSVDVTITHKNPPPGATVTAAGMGDVNVGAPRTEQQSLGNVA
jgi:Phage tail lysozyme